MLKAISVREVIDRCRSRLQTFRAEMSDRTLKPHSFHVGLPGLEHACELLEQLGLQGFDEIFVPEEGEALSFRDGWLPLRGSDLLKYLRALKAAGVHKTYTRDANPAYYPSPYIYVIDDGLYVRMPLSSFLGHTIAYVRLDDAVLGERFTEGMVVGELGDRDRRRLGRYWRGHYDLVKAVHTVDVRDYLKVAGKVCGYAVRLYEETGFPVQMLTPYLNASNPLYLLIEGRDIETMRFAARLGDTLGYLRPYDPRFGYVVAPTKLPHTTPKLYEVWDEGVLKSLAALAGSGTKLYSREDGSGLYLLEGPGSERALRRALGRRSFELFKAVLPLLGSGLYLCVEAGDRLYYPDRPAPEYVATVLAAYALNLDGEFLRAQVDGLPSPLLGLLSVTPDLDDRRTSYRIATAPKKIDVGGDGAYYDGETGLGVVVY